MKMGKKNQPWACFDVEGWRPWLLATGWRPLASCDRLAPFGFLRRAAAPWLLATGCPFGFLRRAAPFGFLRRAAAPCGSFVVAASRDCFFCRERGVNENREDSEYVVAALATASSVGREGK